MSHEEQMAMLFLVLETQCGRVVASLCSWRQRGPWGYKDWGLLWDLLQKYFSAMSLLKVNFKNLHVTYCWIHPQQRWGKMKAKSWWKSITLTSLWCQIFKKRKEEKIPLAVSCGGLNQSRAYTPFGFVFSAAILHLHYWNILPLPN